MKLPDPTPRECIITFAIMLIVLAFALGGERPSRLPGGADFKVASR